MIGVLHFSLLALWLAFAAVALAGIVAALVWAVRSGQFSGQDHARHLPLESGIPEPPNPKQEDHDAAA